MGNNLCGYDPCCSNEIRVGDFATIHTRKYDQGGYNKFRTLSYIVYGSFCRLDLGKFIDENGRVRQLILALKDDKCFGSGISISIERYKKNYLWICPRADTTFMYMTSYKSTTNTKEGNVIVTELFRYGGGTRGGLVVLVVYKKDLYPYKATVAHYYASSRGLNKDHIGFSIVVDIWASDKNLYYKGDGPNRHHSSALFNMFDMVFRTGIWKVTSCHHCADEVENEGGDGKNNDLSVPKGNTNWSLDLINNKDINGIGNGNRIEGNQIINHIILTKPSYLISGSENS